MAVFSSCREIKNCGYSSGFPPYRKFFYLCKVPRGKEWGCASSSSSSSSSWLFFLLFVLLFRIRGHRRETNRKGGGGRGVCRYADIFSLSFLFLFLSLCLAMCRRAAVPLSLSLCCVVSLFLSPSSHCYSGVYYLSAARCIPSSLLHRTRRETRVSLQAIFSPSSIFNFSLSLSLAISLLFYLSNFSSLSLLVSSS